jgi:uncharacterized FAD-dependent dehydrogenase
MKDLKDIIKNLEEDLKQTGALLEEVEVEYKARCEQVEIANKELRVICDLRRKWQQVLEADKVKLALYRALLAKEKDSQ